MIQRADSTWAEKRIFKPSETKKRTPKFTPAGSAELRMNVPIGEFLRFGGLAGSIKFSGIRELDEGPQSSQVAGPRPDHPSPGRLRPPHH